MEEKEAKMKKDQWELQANFLSQSVAEAKITKEKLEREVEIAENLSKKVSRFWFWNFEIFVEWKFSKFRFSSFVNILFFINFVKILLKFNKKAREEADLLKQNAEKEANDKIAKADAEFAEFKIFIFLIIYNFTYF